MHCTNASEGIYVCMSYKLNNIQYTVYSEHIKHYTLKYTHVCVIIIMQWGVLGMEIKLTLVVCGASKY